MPGVITAGDTYSWLVGYADFPASSSWSLTYYFTRPGEETIALTTTASGSDFSATLAAEDSAEFVPGRWRWAARAELQGTGRQVADRGIITVKPDPESEGGETLAEKMLKAYEAVLLQRAGEAFNGVDAQGTSLDQKSDEELQRGHSFWLARVNRERARRESLESGRPRRTSRVWLAPNRTTPRYRT